jgi:hypothetical protein
MEGIGLMARSREEIRLVGEKRGDALIVQGERFTAHHEDRSTE